MPGVGPRYLYCFPVMLLKKTKYKHATETLPAILTGRNRIGNKKYDSQQAVVLGHACSQCIRTRKRHNLISTKIHISNFCHAMLCISTACDVARCLSVRPSVLLFVTFMYFVGTNKHIFNFCHIQVKGKGKGAYSSS